MSKTETSTHDFHIAPPFTDERNITVGNARIIWARSSHALICDEGWMLPGGGMTTDRYEAHAYAVRMNTLMGGEK